MKPPEEDIDTVGAAIEVLQDSDASDADVQAAYDVIEDVGGGDWEVPS